jgi:uncharacterized membrane protein YfcA
MLLLALCFIITGLVVGVLSGLFGLGGGLTIVPMMIIFLSIYEPSYSTNFMHIAVATSLFVMIFTSLTTTYTHHKAKNIIWNLVFPIKFGVIVGTIIGAIFASYLSSDILKNLFLIFLIYTIIKWIIKSFAKKIESNTLVVSQPLKLILLIYGFITGAIAVLLGIGASVMIVPFLKHKKFSMSQSAAIAAAVTPFIALFGAITYIITGFTDPNLPTNCFGYVYIPASIGLIVGAMAGAPIGTWLSSRVSANIQNWIYLGFLVIILIVMAS